MSTVGRIGWSRALTKVLTRSRGTPAAAFAMYCSRKVLVDTELQHCTRRARRRALRPPSRRSLLREIGPRVARDPDVLVDGARDAGVDRAGPTDWRSQVDHVRLWPVRVVRVHPLRVDHATGRTVPTPLDLGEVEAPRHFPEVPALVAERHGQPHPVEDGVFAAPDDDAEGHRAGQEVAAAALLDGKPIVVRRDVGGALLHAHDLRLVARRPFAEP